MDQLAPAVRLQCAPPELKKPPTSTPRFPLRPCTQELYKPPYLFASNRPALAKPDAPTWVPYGSTFKLGYSFPDAPGERKTNALHRISLAAWHLWQLICITWQLAAGDAWRGTCS